jgi:hypothetical protein
LWTPIDDKKKAYGRRLARYNLTDRQLRQKYQMSFEEFERQKVMEQRGYTWEVESDAIAWETAMDGIRTVQRQLSDLLHTLADRQRTCEE